MQGLTLIEIFLSLLGGFIISSVVILSYRYGKKVTMPSNSLFGFITGDFYSKWRSTFIAGMLFVATLAWYITGSHSARNPYLKPFEREKLFFKGTGLIQFIMSGFLIGLGTKLAEGGLNRFAFYGVPRFNRRSLISMGIVLLCGIFTATLRSDFPLLKGLNLTKKFNEHFDFRLSFIIPLSILFYNLARNYNSRGMIREILTSFGMGGLLASGMMIAGLGRRHAVLDFLSFNSKWDPFLIFVIIGAVLGNIILWNVLAPGLSVSVTTEPEDKFGFRMILGSALFGAGMGISGLIPGTGLLVSPVYLPQIVLFFLPFIAVGQFVVDYMNRNILKGPKTMTFESSTQEKLKRTT